ncbi:MAG: tRNA lysidine(34) synthetase TilS [Alphaproteobacteria bacterium]|nr:tRNA lysidine(34) synthetase TilS [Alphaproteobacteria bacterium]
MIPITLSEFEQSMEGAVFPLAVAVSGGSDSLALMLLAHKLAQKKGSYVIALTVDHGLREESREEGRRVAQWAQAQNIQHVILDWVGDKPTARIQEKARKARYALLTQWCHQNRISTLLLGHHQQDQEETFWLRLSSGSGLTGLSGMKKRTVRDGILFLRPILDFPKECLVATLSAHNQEWIEDPSNHNPHFFRGRLRQFLSEEGLVSGRLNQVIKKLQMDADFIQSSLENAIAHVVQAHDSGYLAVKKEYFSALHPAIAKRLLSFLMQWFSNADYSPRATQVTGVMDKIKKGIPFTTGGIYWVFSHEEIFLFRERRAIQQGFSISSLQEKTLWDQRFWIDPQLKEYVPEGTILGSLKSGWLNSTVETKSLSRATPWKSGELSEAIQKCHMKKLDCAGAHVPRNDNLGKAIYLHQFVPTLPALWVKGKVVAVPHLCYATLECEKDLRKFIYLKPLFHDSLRFTI